MCKIVGFWVFTWWGREAKPVVVGVVHHLCYLNPYQPLAFLQALLADEGNHARLPQGADKQSPEEEEAGRELVVGIESQVVHGDYALPLAQEVEAVVHIARDVHDVIRLLLQFSLDTEVVLIDILGRYRLVGQVDGVHLDAHPSYFPLDGLKHPADGRAGVCSGR